MIVKKSGSLKKPEKILNLKNVERKSLKILEF